MKKERKQENPRTLKTQKERKQITNIQLQSLNYNELPKKSKNMKNHRKKNDGTKKP